LAECQFTTTYYDYGRKAIGNFDCHEAALPSGLCLFHDENYLKEGEQKDRKEHEQKVRDKLMAKVHNSIDKKEVLFCIGYHLPGIAIREIFPESVYFTDCKFQGIANFISATFSGEKADFDHAAFFDRTYFSDYSPDLGSFNGETTFNYVVFEAKEKIIFDVQDLSKVSFMN
jgi:hypothetical protein